MAQCPSEYWDSYIRELEEANMVALNKTEATESRSVHLTWGGIWEMAVKEIFTAYMSATPFDSTGCRYVEDDIKEIAAAAGKQANLITDELLMQAYGYCRTNGIDPNKPVV